MVALVTGAGLGLEKSSGFVLGSRGQLGLTGFGRFGENVTVNAATGNLVLSRADEILIGKGPDAVLARSYNSLATGTDDNGDNWQLGAQRRVAGLTGTVSTAGSTITRYDWDGSSSVYSWDAAASAYVGKDGGGSYDRLTFAANVWTWTDGDSRVVEKYDALNSGRITFTTDTDGNSLTYSYTGTLLTRVATANGEYTDLTWSGNNLTQVATNYTPVGREATIVAQIYRMYDAAFNRTVDASGYSSNMNAMLAGQSLETFATNIYNSAEYQTRNVASMTNSQFVDFLYTSVLRRSASASENNAWTSNLNGGMTRGQILMYFSESAEHITVTASSPTRNAPATLSLTRVRYAYDASNRLSTVTTDLTPIGSLVSDGKIVVTTYTYDGASDRVASISQTGGAQLTIGYTLVGSTYRVTSYTQTLASGVTNVTTLSYDTTNRVTTITDDLGQVTKLTYDASNQLTKIELPPAQSGMTGQVIQYGYNGNGDVTSETDAAGNVTTYVYDASGNLVDRGDPDGTHTLYSYNASNQLIKSTVVPSLAGLTTLPTLGVDVEYYLATYSDIAAAGNTVDPVRHAMNSGWTERRDPNAIFNTDYYLTQNADVAAGGMNPLIHYLQFGWREGRAPSATSTTAEFIARYVNQSTRYVYDAEQHLRFTVSPEGRVTEYRYDAAGQQTSVIDYPQKSYNVGALASTATLSESTMTGWVSGLGDLTGSQRKDMSYDFRGNISTVKTYAATDTSATGTGTTSIVTYIYDQYGNLLTRQTSGVTNSEIFVYDGISRVTTAIDLDGGATSTVFTDSSNQQVVTLANGLVQTSLYDVAGNLVSYQTSGTGLTTGKTTYSYDDLGRLRSLTYVDNPGDATPPVVKSYYLYDAVGRKIADIATDGAITEYGYDARDRLIKTAHYSTGLGASALASLVDANGRPANIALASVRPAGTADDQWEWRVYDTDDHLLEIIDATGDVTSFTYDTLGNLVATKVFYNKLTSSLAGFKTSPPTSVILPTAHAKDALTRNFFDEDGALIGTLDALGYFTQIRYDSAGRKIATVAYANQVAASLRAAGSFEQMVGGLTGTVRDISNFFVYDASGRLQYSLDANLRPTEFVYDGAGNVVQTIEYGASIASGIAYTAAYVAGQINSLNLSNHADTRKSWAVYNDAGRLAYAIDANGGVKAFAYDNMGNVYRTIQYVTSRATTGLPNMATMNSWVLATTTIDDRITRYYYDTRGQQRYIVDAAGYVTRNDFDLEGRPVATIGYDVPYGATDATTYANISAASLGGYAATQQTYDPLGRVSTTIDNVGTVTKFVYDAFDQVVDRIVAYGTTDAAVTHYTYDAAGHVLTETAAYGTSDASTITYAYDGFGNVITKIDGNNFTTSYAYDSLRQLLSLTTPIDASNTAVTSYSYDPFGNAISTTDARGNISYATYDVLNRLIWQVDAEGYVTQTSYTIGDEVRMVTRYAAKATASGPAIVPTITVTVGDDASTIFTRDKLGRVTQVTDAEGSYEQYALNAFGDRISVRNKLGGVTTNMFDRRGLLLSEVLPMNSVRADGTLQAPSVTNSYQYDSRGNRVVMIEAAGLSEQRITTYAYDRQNRLISTTGMAVGLADDASLGAAGSYQRVDTVAYDKRGNVIETRIQQKIGATYTDVSRTLTYYDDLDRKIAQIDPAGLLSTWTYDKDGNVTLAETSSANRIGYSQFESGTTGWANLYNPSSIVTSGPYTGTSNGKSFLKADVNATAVGQVFSLGIASANRFAVNPGERLSVQVGVEGLGSVGNVTVNVWWIATDGSVISSSNLGALSGNPIYDSKIKGFVTAPAGAVQGFVEIYGTTTTTGAGSLAITEPAISTATATQTDPIAFVAGPVAGSVQEAKRSTSFTYDRAGRLLTSSVGSMQVGYWNGSSFVTPALASLTSTNVYDQAGNIIQQTDARGNSIFTFYDKLGRKVAQVDQEKYLTTYTLDADGNVTSELRYATPLASPPAAGVMPSPPATSGNDRTTNFTYDRNGRRLSETRIGVSYSAIDANGNKTDYTGQSATITYGYNGLGEISYKVEAAGDSFLYYYDSMGRQNLAIGTVINDVNNQSVRSATYYQYDGLNNVAQTTERSVLNSDWAVNSGEVDRITRYYYNAAGQLTRMQDAANFDHYYDYNAAGGMVRDRYQRTNAAGNVTTWEAQDTRYDVAGHAVKQAVRIWSGSSWAVPASETRLTYNVYGEVIGKGTNAGNGSSSAYQEMFDYDAAGRIWRSTAGDGVTKLFLYDQNGNQSVAITSSGPALPAGYAWSTLTVAQAVSLLTNNGANALGTIAVPGMVVTISAYDARGLNIETRAPLRDTSAVGSNTLIRQQRVFNAFGEVAQEVDARNNVTDFAYNTLGKIVQKQSPTVSWTAENGAQANDRPTENYFYDLSGRLVAVQDANGNVNKLSLLGGTGYGGEDALILKEFHADGGIIQNKYNVFGDKRVIVNEVGQTDTYSYDARGLLVQLNHQQAAGVAQLIDYYSYDILGQRLTHYNSQLGATVKDSTDYDALGRVTSMIDFGNAVTSYTYTWSNTAAATGLVTTGGWIKTTTNSAGQSEWEITSYFGKIVDRVDYGGQNYDYSYDSAQRLIQVTNNATSSVNYRVANTIGLTLSYSYYNSGLLASAVKISGNGFDTTTSTDSFAYDVDGNRTREKHEVTGTRTFYGSTTTQTLGSTTASDRTVSQDLTFGYDGLNRVVSATQTAGATSHGVSIAWEYDLASNVRRLKASYEQMDLQGQQAGTPVSQDNWYRYDAMNRFVTTKGMLVATNGSGQLVLGDAARGLGGAAIKRYDRGVDISYNAAGQRTAAARTQFTPGSMYTPAFYQELKESYAYTADGYLESASIASGTGLIPANGGSYANVTPASGTGDIRARYTRDAMGRVVGYTEYGFGGYVASNPAQNAAYSRNAVYDAKSNVTSDTVTTWRSDGTSSTSWTTYYYGATQSPTQTGVWVGGTAGSYMGGAVTYSIMTTSDSSTTSTTTTRFSWWDGAQRIQEDNTGAVPGRSSYYYDDAGTLASVNIDEAGGSPRDRSVWLRSDAQGLFLDRSEQDDNGALGDPREVHYYLNGAGIGDISNNGTSDVDYIGSISAHTTVQGTGPFRGGGFGGSLQADFDQSYDPVNGLNYQNTASRYTVQDGDTVEGIALKLWGDASFWYMIADANGLTGGETLAAGRTLVIPNKVHNAHNSADVYRVYDPNKIVGSTAPTAPAAPKGKKGCGVFGQILMVAIAIVVTAVTAGGAAAAILPGTQGILGGLGAIATAGVAGSAGAALSIGAAIGISAGAAALGSVVSQGFGVVTGIQDKFSWKGVALSALAGGIGGGIGASGFLKAASPFVSGVARGVLSSALTQGIAVTTGLQSRFDWAGVAAAGIGAGVGGAIHLGGIEGRIISGMAGGIAGAAASSLVSGNSFGDTIMQSLPSVIGNTIGALAADRIAGNGRNRTTGAGDGKANQPVAGEGGGQVGGSADGDIIVNPSFMNRVHMDFALASAGGDIQAAREMYRSYFAPSQDEALALATPAGLGEVSAQYDASTGAEGSFKGQYMNYPDHLSPDGNSIGHIGIVDGGGTWVPNPERTAAMQAALAQFDSELGSILAIGPQTALSMVGYVPGAAMTVYDYSQGNVSLGEASVSLIPGERVLGALNRVSHTAQVAENGLAGSSKLWTRTEVNGTRVYQRSDLIEAGAVDSLGRTNLQRMERGLAPLGPDGKSMNLHHMLQTNDGPLAEMTQTFHQKYSSTIHINPNTTPSGIDRRAFDAYRKSYWQARANDFK